jgi:hypothetical protein
MARRVLPVRTPLSVITARTALKIRSRSSEARSLLRHSVSRVERLIGERQPRGGLPGDVRRQLTDRVPVRQPLERLEHHRGRHHIGWHRWTASARREQVGEHLVGEQAATVLGQERVHRSLGHQVTAQRRRVQQLPVRVRGPLHPAMLHDPRRGRESPATPDCEAKSG